LLSFKEIYKPIRDFSKDFIKKIRNEVLSLNNLRLDSFVLVAVGGLGRLEQGKYSDVDLLFITYDDDSVKPVISLLWEKGYEISYSVRDFENILVQSKNDITFFTSILFSKYIVGSKELYSRFLKLKKSLIKDNRIKVLEYFNDRFKTIDYYNKEEIFLNHPDLKNSYGGLRSYQIINWLIRLYPELRSIRQSELYNKALISYLKLFQIREKITILLKRKINIVTIDILQIIIGKDKKKSYFEEFIKDIFVCFSDIFDFVIYFKDIINERFYKRKNCYLKSFDNMLFDKNYSYIKNVKDVNLCLDFIYNTIKIGKKISYSSIIEIKNYITTVDLNKSNIDKFHEHIAELQIGLYDYFLYLDVIGFLPKIIPFYSEMVLRPQIDYYHDFTLSYHSLFMINNFSNIFLGSGSNDYFITEKCYELSVNDKIVLIYSILLHDVGKIMDGDHIVNNIKLISKITASLSLKDDEKYIVEFLVINHLLLSDVVNAKDINEKIVSYLVEKIEDKRKLRLLFILTYLDMNSVNKNRVPLFIIDKLVKIYKLCSEYFDKGKIDISRDSVVNRLINKVDINILNTLPDEYLYDIDDKDIIEDIKYIGSENVLIDNYKGLKRIKYFGKDYKGLLLKIVLPITLNYMDIVDAGIYTLYDGNVIDYFFCNPISNIDDDTLKQKILDSVKSDFNKNINIYKLFYNKLYSTIKKEIYYIEPVVVVNHLRDNYFYVNISTRSFPGLLYFLLKFFLDNGFNIKKSKIHTVGIRAKDGFYIEGENIEDLDKKLLSYIHEVSKNVFG